MDLGFWAEELQVRSVEEENGDPVKEAGACGRLGSSPAAGVSPGGERLGLEWTKADAASARRNFIAF